MTFYVGYFICEVAKKVLLWLSYDTCTSCFSFCTVGNNILIRAYSNGLRVKSIFGGRTACQIAFLGQYCDSVFPPTRLREDKHTSCIFNNQPGLKSERFI